MKCNHEITTVHAAQLAGFDMGVRVLCVGCGIATGYRSTYRSAKRAWKLGQRKQWEGSKETAAAIRRYKIKEPTND